VISKSLIVGVGLAGVGLGLAGAFSTPAEATGLTTSCSASTVVGSCTGSFVVATCNTDWSNVHVLVSLFNSSVYAPMTSMSLTVSGTVQFNAGSYITNGGSSPENATQIENSSFFFSTSNSGLAAALAALAPAPVASTSQSVAGLATSSTFTLSTSPGTAFSSSVTGPLADFEQAGGGNANVLVTTYTENLLASTGGNITSSVSTADTLTLSWVYNYGVAAPEPISASVLASGLLGLGMLRRRKRSRT
jgi:hypothetical protein